MSVRTTQTSRARIGLIAKGNIDATLAANLPASPVGGDTYQITVEGTFQDSALVSPVGTHFKVTDFVVWNQNTDRWNKIDSTDNISDAAYDEATWDGDAIDAPSKNAVRDQLVTRATATGLNADGTYTPPTGSPHHDTATSLKNADSLIDAALGAHKDATGTAVHGLGSMSTQAANNVAITGGTITGVAVSSTTIDAVTAPDNAATLNVNIPVTGTDAGPHTINMQINGNTALSLTATGDGAGGVGVRTLSILSGWTASGQTCADLGSVTTADINGGTIDGTDITVGAGKTLDVSAGTLTLADDQISGDKVEGGTINATTITTLTSTTVNATTFDTNVAAAGVTLSGTTLAADGTDPHIDINLTPKGTGALSVAGTANYEQNVTADDDIPNKKYVDDAAFINALIFG
jgi:hypothetical protein